MKVVIVGGVAGGASAAARIRRLDEQAQIVVFERTGYMSYANCGLPYYIGGVIEDPEELTLQTPESFYRRFRVDVRLRHEVISIDPVNRTVLVRDLSKGVQFMESYDKLLLAPGAKPIVPAGTEVDNERIFVLRTVEDTFQIRQFVIEKKPASVLIAGGGFIGLEMAENLCDLGIQVTLVQRPKQVLPMLDEDMAAQLHGLLRKRGVQLKLGSTVTALRKDGDRITALLKDEAPIVSDMVLLAIGVSPESKLARDAGLALGQKGAVQVNDRMETSAPHIYAVGDAVEVLHRVTGLKTVIPLAGPANKQGRIAADNICGGDSRYGGSQGSSIIKLFDMTAAATGINEKIARSSGLDYDKIVLSPANHAGYYPDGKVMTMKVLFERETCRLLGAQIVGYEGVDKRIDVLAAAIHCGAKATDLAEFDLAYAPPYSSAKDPVNMAGFMIDNLVSGKIRQFHWHDVCDLPRDGSVTLLDSRTTGEYRRGHVDGFINIPVDELRDRVAEIAAGKPVYVMCQSGLRSYIACRILCNLGYDCYNFSGGYRFYHMVLTDKIASVSAFPCGLDK